MIDIAKYRWWEEGVILVDGCTPCSPGCRHCWSALNSYRFYPGKYAWKSGDVIKFNDNIEVHPERLKRFNTRKPKVFAIWNDLFHEAVPFHFIDDVMTGIAKTEISLTWRGKPEQGNTFLILTKRPSRLYEWANSTNARLDYLKTLSNLYFGLTVCDQPEADAKLPEFLQVPGKKFLSIEPMLGPIDLIKKPAVYTWEYAKASGHIWGDISGIDAVILGGETGPGARPLHPDWVRSVRDQCAAAGVPFFFKGFGRPPKNTKYLLPRHIDGRTHDELPWRQA